MIRETKKEVCVSACVCVCVSERAHPSPTPHDHCASLLRTQEEKEEVLD